MISSGDRHNPIAIVHIVVVEKAVVAVRNPRVVGIVPQARPEVGCHCQYNGVGMNDTYWPLFFLSAATIFYRR